MNEIAVLNKDLQECRDTPPVKIESPLPEIPPVIVDCNTTVNSGGQGVTETEHRLGSTGGTVLLEYDALTIPDEFTIIYNGQIVASTNGLVSEYGSLSWTYTASPGNPEYCTVKVSAPRDNTKWTYRLNCPVP